MTGPAVAPYGAWPSPISAESLVAGAVGIAEVMADPAQSRYLWWAETRPDEGGRTAVMRHCLSTRITEEFTGPGADVRTLVHEYGGGAWWPHDGRLFYADRADQRLRRLDSPGGEPVMLTPQPPGPRAWRYADGRVTPDGRWCVCVRERHRVAPGREPADELTGAADGPDAAEKADSEPVDELAVPADGPDAAETADSEPVNELVAVAADGSQRVEVLWSGSDFVMAPRPSPAGDRLAWISWDHPHMPWDATRLHVHELGDGALGAELAVVGERGDRSLVQPGWQGDRLLVGSDHHDWWNLYEVDLATGALAGVMTGECDVAGGPAWVLGIQRWGAGEAGIVAAAGRPTGDDFVFAAEGVPVVLPGSDAAAADSGSAAVPPSAGAAPGSAAAPIAAAAADSAVASVAVADHAGTMTVAYAAAGWGHEPEVVAVTAGAGADKGLAPERRVIRPSRPLGFGPGFAPPPEAIAFPAVDVGGAGPPASAQAHGLFYRPANPGCVGPPGELPPLLVLAHGGPTAAARRQLQPSILYWTSRGIAVVDVDYRGSTGYGRPYRRALDGGWGEIDVADCAAAARYLVDRGEADPERLIIRGSSAGGLTVLAALALHDTFAAGASRYGVADLTALAADTHKFESRYLDTLVGPYPEARRRYEERSPINHVDSITAPLIVLQGSEDAIVPPDQSSAIVAALESKGVPVAYLLFEGEQHGFRRAETIVTALESELAFFGRVLGFNPADNLPPVKIRGLDDRQFGAMKGRSEVDDRFFEPLPEDELAAWEK